MEQPQEFALLYEEWLRGKISARAAGEKLGISHKAFLKWARRNLEKKVEIDTHMKIYRDMHEMTKFIQINYNTITRKKQ